MWSRRAITALALAGVLTASPSVSLAQETTSYTYDALGRVTTVVGSANTAGYTYDPAGNRSQVAVTNMPPGAQGGAMSVPFGGSATLALPVSGQATGAVVDAAPAKGAVSFSGTNVTYTASGANYGPDSFTYHATGPGGNSPVQTINVTIANPPAPTVGAVSTSTAYNTAKVIGLTPSGVYSALAVAAGPAHGSASISGTTATYTPTAGYYGADAFTYTATGPGGISAAATVSISVATPAAPTVGAVSTSTAYNTAKAVTLTPAGVYGSLAVAAAPAHGTASISGVTATYTPTGGYYGADSFTYTATGPGGTSAAATVLITVANPSAPTVAGVSTSTTYNTAKAITLSPSGVYATLVVASAPAHGTASISGVTATYTPAAGYYGADSFTYTATGPGGTSAAASVLVTVGNPPAPGAADTTINTAYNTTGSVTLPGTGVVTAYGIIAQPSHGAAGISGAIGSYTPVAGYYGPDSFTYYATGPGGNSPARTITVTVGLPPAPTAAGASITSTYNGSGAVALPVSGAYNSIGFPGGSPAHGVLNLTGSTVTYYPTAGFYGGDSFTYNATGPGGTSSPATVSVAVATPAAPTVGAASISSTYNGSGSVALPIGGVYTGVTFATGPGHGSLSRSGNVVTYTPNAGYYSGDSFTYFASGPGGNSGTATVSVMVATPPAPTVGAVSASTAYNTPVTVALSPSGAYSSVNLSYGASHGLATVSGTSATYTPQTGYFGTDTFQYTASGGGGTSAPATVTITVATPPNRPPVANSDTLTLACNTSATVNLTANDTDPEGNVPLSLVSIGSGFDVYGNVVSGSSASITAGAYFGNYVLNYTVADSLGATSIGSLSVNVTGSDKICSGE